MSKHTPGPWEVQTLQYSRDHNLGIRVRGENVSGYAAFLNTRWPHVAQQEEQYANARLIAAAPELAEALQNVITAWDRVYASINLPEQFEDVEFREMNRARASIRKATGEQA